jgi:hypothetical protein
MKEMFSIRAYAKALAEIGFLCAVMAAASGCLRAAETTIAWNASSGIEVAGYRIYVGTSSGTYRAPVDVGNVTTYTVKDLGVGTYYFVVTAYNRAGLESSYSNEISRFFGSTSVPIAKYDLNGDQAVDALDLQTLGSALGNPLSCPKCDLNGDGVLDVLDLRVLANVILGAGKCP